MPTVNIWRPHGEDNPYGHVTLSTDKYYVSFWSAQVLESDDSDEEIQESREKRLKRKWTNVLSAVGVFKGHRGGLVLHRDLDKEYEGERDPIDYQIDATVTDKDVNSIYEEFLHYNRINPEDVTLARGEELYKTRKEYEQLSPEEARLKVEEPEVPQQSLTKTGYSFSAELVACKDDGDSVPFYHQQQSCVSFVFNLVQTAWLKHHPDRPIPILFKKPGVLIAPNIVRNNESGDLGEYAYEVPWFEQQVVQNYLLDPVTLLENSATSALKISLGILTRPFKVFFPAVFAISFLHWYFPWLVGLPCDVVFLYRYGCQLGTFLNRNPQEMKETLSTRLNYWVIFYILNMYYLICFSTLSTIFEIATFLLDNTDIEMTLLMFMLVLLLIRGLEEKLSIMEKAGKAIAPLVYFILCIVNGIYMQCKSLFGRFFLSDSTGV